MKNAARSLHFSRLKLQQIWSRSTLLIPVFFIFAVVFSLAAIHNVYDTRVHARAYGNNAIATFEHYIDQTASELEQLNRNLDGFCDEPSIQQLRQYIFHSPMAKEIALFDSDGTIYCSSNQGYIDTQINDSVLNRVKNNREMTTISFAQSSSHDEAISIYFANQDLSGTKVLLPPKQFLQLVSSEFKQHYFNYEVKVLHHLINKKSLNEPENTQVMQFYSLRYPLAISLQITPLSYWAHFELHLWKITLIACLLAFLHQAVRHYSITRNSLGFSLKEAISNQELELHFQPIVDIHNHRIVGSEALIRWHNRDHGVISPSVFIPLAEQMQVIEPITRQVLKLVTDFVLQNPHLVKDQYISINLSRTLIIQGKFIDYLARYAKQHASVLPLLLIEITEDNNFSAQELVIVRRNLNRLKASGFKIAMDDFGTGYSGLNFIHQHAFHTIKIDQVFINGLCDNSAVQSVLQSMVKLAKQLQMRVIAEGAETHDQVEQLRQLGIQYIQGFYYFKPLPAEDYLLKLSAQMEYS